MLDSAHVVPVDSITGIAVFVTLGGRLFPVHLTTSTTAIPHHCYSAHCFIPRATPILCPCQPVRGAVAYEPRYHRTGTALPVPVPSGTTITTRVCVSAHHHNTQHPYYYGVTICNTLR